VRNIEFSPLPRTLARCGYGVTTELSEMRILYLCPNCQQTNRLTVTETSEKLSCSDCSWTRPLPADPLQRVHPEQCLVCGCRDLWRQKDFPQRLGVAMVAAGGILSTIAYYYHYHLWALGILMVFALIQRAERPISIWKPTNATARKPFVCRRIASHERGHSSIDRWSQGI
jgi:hypothetical protein